MKTKTIKCKFCNEPLCEGEYEAYIQDGRKLCYNWESELEEHERVNSSVSV